MGFFSHIFRSPIFKIAAPIALSFLAPGIGTALGGALGAGAGIGASALGNGLIGAGLGAIEGGGLKGAITGGVSGGIGGAAQGYFNGASGAGNILTNGGSASGNAADLTNFAGGTISGSAPSFLSSLGTSMGTSGSSVLGSIGQIGSVLGAMNNAQTLINNNKLPNNAITPGPAQAPTFTPTTPAAMAAPGSLSGLSGYTQDQTRSSLATQGLNTGLGAPESAYYNNLVQRSLIGDNNKVAPNTNSLLPVESQYYSRQGIDTGNINNFLKALQDQQTKYASLNS